MNPDPLSRRTEPPSWSTPTRTPCPPPALRMAATREAVPFTPSVVVPIRITDPIREFFSTFVSAASREPVTPIMTS